MTDWENICLEVKTRLTGGLADNECSKAPVMGGKYHRQYRNIDRGRLSKKFGGELHHQQEFRFGGEKIIVWRTHGLSDRDCEQMLTAWMMSEYERIIEEL